MFTNDNSLKSKWKQKNIYFNVTSIENITMQSVSFYFSLHSPRELYRQACFSAHSYYKNSGEKSKKTDIRRPNQWKKRLFKNILELLRINFEIILLTSGSRSDSRPRKAELLGPRPKNLVPHVSSYDTIACLKGESGSRMDCRIYQDSLFLPWACGSKIFGSGSGFCNKF
jgi:hypothetical protein